MKYEIYKLLRDWTFWLLIFLSVIFIVGFSAVYFIQSDDAPPHWGYSIPEYRNDEDIQKQIDSCKAEITELEEKIQEGSIVFKESSRERLENLYASVKILEFLNGKTEIYPFHEICDGNHIDYYVKYARVYSFDTLPVLVLFQIVAMIFSVGQIINQGKTSGTFVFPLLMKGRKKTFKRQAIISLGTFTFSYLLQVGMIAVIRMFLDHKVKYAVYVIGNNVSVIKESLEFITYALSYYLLLIFFWAFILLISQLTDNLAVFSVTSLLSCAAIILWVSLSKSYYISDFMSIGLADLIISKSQKDFIIVYSVRAVLIAACLFGAYFIAKKKNYRVRYE